MTGTKSLSGFFVGTITSFLRPALNQTACQSSKRQYEKETQRKNTVIIGSPPHDIDGGMCPVWRIRRFWWRHARYEQYVPTSETHQGGGIQIEPACGLYHHRDGPECPEEGDRPHEMRRL